MTRHEKVPRLLGSSLTDLDLVTSGRGGSAESNEEAGNVPTRCSFYLFTEFSAGKMASKRSFDLSGPFQPRRDATISLYVLSPRFFGSEPGGHRRPRETFCQGFWEVHPPPVPEVFSSVWCK